MSTMTALLLLVCIKSARSSMVLEFLIAVAYLTCVRLTHVGNNYVHLKKSEKNPDIFLDFFLDFFLDIFLDISIHFNHIKNLWT